MELAKLPLCCLCGKAALVEILKTLGCKDRYGSLLLAESRVAALSAETCLSEESESGKPPERISDIKTERLLLSKGGASSISTSGVLGCSLALVIASCMLRCLASAAALRAAPQAAASLSSETLLGSMPSGRLLRDPHG